MTATDPKSTKTRGTAKNLLFQKVAIFVDAENIEMSSLKHHEGRTDYKKILEKVGDREIIRILYYKPIYKDISPEFEAFWAGLGGEIRRPSKNADTFLVIDAVTMAEKIDVAIILGGDKDFQPLIWFLRSRGCRVEIWSWPETTSPEMQQAADLYQPLTEEFVIGKSGSRNADRNADRSVERSHDRSADVKPVGRAPVVAAPVVSVKTDRPVAATAASPSTSAPGGRGSGGGRSGGRGRGSRGGSGRGGSRGGGGGAGTSGRGSSGGGEPNGNF